MHCAVNSLSLRRALRWPADGSWHVCEVWRCPVGTGTNTHARTHTPAPPASPLATAAVLQEAAVPLADQILSVTFPLINGHLLPPFSLHGYTLSLCSSNHLIVMTFNPIRARPPRSAPVFARLAACTSRPPSCLPACHIPAGETQGHANKQTNEAVLIWRTDFMSPSFAVVIIPAKFLQNSLIFKKIKITHKAKTWW